MYQNDYHEVRQKISFYKSKSLDETLVASTIPDRSMSSSQQTLNRAFMMEGEENSEN